MEIGLSEAYGTCVWCLQWGRCFQLSTVGLCALTHTVTLPLSRLPLQLSDLTRSTDSGPLCSTPRRLHSSILYQSLNAVHVYPEAIFEFCHLHCEYVSDMLPSLCGWCALDDTDSRKGWILNSSWENGLHRGTCKSYWRTPVISSASASHLPSTIIHVIHHTTIICIYLLVDMHVFYLSENNFCNHLHFKISSGYFWSELFVYLTPQMVVMGRH